MNQSFIPLHCPATYLYVYAALQILAAVLPVHAAEITVDEIMQRSREAMKPPIRYRMYSEGVATLVCQKILSDGRTATRLESSSPVHKISLIVDESSCDYFPDSGIGIDASFISGHLRGSAQSVSTKTATPARLSTIVSADGRECYVISRPLPFDIGAGLANSIPESARAQFQQKTTRETQTLIDMRSFELVEQRRVSNAGMMISQTQHRAIEHSVALPDDLFLPPDGIELLKPQNLQEYVGMLKEIHMQKAEDVAARRPITNVRSQPVEAAPYRLLRPEIDPRTGRLLPASSPGMRRSEFMRSAPNAHARSIGLTAEGILRRSKEAMKAPTRYRLIRDGISTAVYQVELSGGATATRLETSSPEHKISLALDKVSCEFYPARGRGFDTSFLPKPLIDQRICDQTVDAFFTNLDALTSRAAQVKTVLLESGRKCFEIAMPYHSNLMASFSQAHLAVEPIQTAIPAKTCLMIDEKTFELISARILSETGATISRLEIRDMERPADQFDQFLVPDGIEFAVPHTAAEYDALQAGLLQTQSAEFPTRVVPRSGSRKQTFPPSQRLAHAAQARQTGSTPSESYAHTSSEAVQDRIAVRLANSRAATTQAAPTASSTSAMTRFVLAVIIPLLAFIAWIFFRRQWSASTTPSQCRQRPRSKTPLPLRKSGYRQTAG